MKTRSLYLRLGPKEQKKFDELLAYLRQQTKLTITESQLLRSLVEVGLERQSIPKK